MTAYTLTALAEAGATGRAVQSLVVQPPSLTRASFTPAVLAGGIDTGLTIGLSGPAPAGGVLVPLRLNAVDQPFSPALPPSVVIPPGKRSHQFDWTTVPVGATRAITVTASVDNISLDATLQVLPPLAVQSIDVSTDAVLSGDTAAINVALNAVALADVQVAFDTVDPAHRFLLPGFPARMTIPRGESRGQLSVTTSLVRTRTVVPIVASTGTQQLTTNVAIDPPTLQQLTFLPTKSRRRCHRQSESPTRPDNARKCAGFYRRRGSGDASIVSRSAVDTDDPVRYRSGNAELVGRPSPE